MKKKKNYIIWIIVILIIIPFIIWGYNYYQEKKFNNCYETCYDYMGCGFGVDCTKIDSFIDCKNNCINKYK